MPSSPCFITIGNSHVAATDVVFITPMYNYLGKKEEPMFATVMTITNGQMVVAITFTSVSSSMFLNYHVIKS